jgi:predicted GNAT superfamily acetyltransferase
MVDLLRVPEHRRRRGIGTLIYRSWERRLRHGTTVELFAVDAVARSFWASLGFVDVGDGGMEKIILRHEFDSITRKTEAAFA